MAKQHEVSAPEEDNFKGKFKYYKCNKPKPSFHEVLSVERLLDDKVTSVVLKTSENDPRAKFLGLENQSNWRTYAFRNHPGLFLIRNPFTNLGQRYWIRRCLEEYPKKPNRLNIDIEINVLDWWMECFKNGNVNRHLQKKLRWTTLGYHHDWNTKVYSDENKSSFPEDLAELSDVFARYLGYSDYKAEAAIVNYYHMDSTLSAHTDHSEVNLEAPLFSFSFGQSAIFLLGGKDKSTVPSAILLQSGDVLVMSKEARLCYHAVPRIVPAPCSPWNNLENQHVPYCRAKFKFISNLKELNSIMKKCLDDTEWNQYSNYIEESRINMNVRQVLNERQVCLTEHEQI